MAILSDDVMATDGHLPVTLPLPLLHADDNVLAVHKPAGLLMHRSGLDAHASDDLVSRLRHQLGHAVWPVHRLDKGTSGVVLLARDAATAAGLSAAFADGRVHKEYLALVRGWPPEHGRTEYALARDPELPSVHQPRLAAVTQWQVQNRIELPLQSQPGFDATRLALLSVWPLTGRRHQIRRHMKHIGHPLIGDATHGKGPLNRALALHLGHARLWLHALRIRLQHPATGRWLLLEAPAGEAWRRWFAAGAQTVPPSLVPCPATARSTSESIGMPGQSD